MSSVRMSVDGDLEITKKKTIDHVHMVDGGDCDEGLLVGYDASNRQSHKYANNRTINHLLGKHAQKRLNMLYIFQSK